MLCLEKEKRGKGEKREKEKRKEKREKSKKKRKRFTWMKGVARERGCNSKSVVSLVQWLFMEIQERKKEIN